MNPRKQTRRPEQVEGLPGFFAPVPPPPCLPVVRTQGQSEVQRLLNWWDTLLCEQATLLVEDCRQLQELLSLRAEIGVWEAERARYSQELQASLLSLWEATKKMNGQKKGTPMTRYWLAQCARKFKRILRKSH